MLWRLFHRSKIHRYAHGEQPWALVTGASDGIGKGIADELLSRGLNVILHGRSPSKLARVQAELQAAHPARQLGLLVWDASLPDEGAYGLRGAIERALDGRRLTVLINNLGYTSRYERLDEQDPLGGIDVVLRVGAAFITHVTRACLPVLKQSQPALVVNVTGLTARYPAPFLAVHSGTKAYVETFSRALRIELRRVKPKTDIECLAVDVHNVQSNSNHSTASFFTPTARREARAIVDVVGCNRPYVTAYWRHELMAGILHLLPTSVMEATMARELSSMRDKELALEAESSAAQKKLKLDDNTDRSSTTMGMSRSASMTPDPTAVSQIGAAARESTSQRSAAVSRSSTLAS